MSASSALVVVDSVVSLAVDDPMSYSSSTLNGLCVDAAVFDVIAFPVSPPPPAPSPKISRAHSLILPLRDSVSIAALAFVAVKQSRNVAFNVACSSVDSCQ